VRSLALGGCLTATNSCHLEDLGGFRVGIKVGLRKERKIVSLRERERCTNYGEREWRDLTVSTSGLKIEEFNRRVYFGPS